MEKCTYCVQRIRAAEIEAEREYADPAEGRERPAEDPRRRDRDRLPGGLPDRGDRRSATSTTPTSRSSRWKTEPTNYGLLAELNTMPRTTLPGRGPEPEPGHAEGGP